MTPFTEEKQTKTHGSVVNVNSYLWLVYLQSAESRCGCLGSSQLCALVTGSLRNVKRRSHERGCSC